MADDPVLKKFQTTRYEYWVPAGTYEGDGAYWNQISRAIHWAHKDLERAGKLEKGREAAVDQIKILPHDEHVIVRYEIEEEVEIDGR